MIKDKQELELKAKAMFKRYHDLYLDGGIELCEVFDKFFEDYNAYIKDKYGEQYGMTWLDFDMDTDEMTENTLSIITKLVEGLKVEVAFTFTHCEYILTVFVVKGEKSI